MKVITISAKKKKYLRALSVVSLSAHMGEVSDK